MNFRYLGLVPLLAGACAHSTPEPVDNTPVTGKMQKADIVFLQRDPESKANCKADADCPVGDYCHPDQLVCFQSYPHPRMLDIGFSPDPECKIVNVYFAYDSTELVPEAQRWLDYNIRCFKSRGAKLVHLDAHCDARGSQKFNRELSERRAQSVKQLLEQKGLDIPITVYGAGEHHPLRDGKSEKDYAFNRRVEFTLD